MGSAWRLANPCPGTEAVIPNKWAAEEAGHFSWRFGHDTAPRPFAQTFADDQIRLGEDLMPHAPNWVGVPDHPESGRLLQKMSLAALAAPLYGRCAPRLATVVVADRDAAPGEILHGIVNQMPTGIIQTVIVRSIVLHATDCYVMHIDSPFPHVNNPR